MRNAGDWATQLSADHLVKPLADKVAGELSDWQVQTVLKDEATKARLSQLLGGAETPSLLFSASHGMGFPNGDPRQLEHQGCTRHGRTSGGGGGDGVVAIPVGQHLPDRGQSAKSPTSRRRAVANTAAISARERGTGQRRATWAGWTSPCRIAARRLTVHRRRTCG